MKRIFSLLFVAMLAGQAWAQTTFTVDKIKYTVTDETNHCVSAGKGTTAPSGAIVIPPKVTNLNDGVEYTVTAIGNRAFMDCYNIKSVSLPETVTIIGNESFRGCSNLTTINIPNLVTYIDGGAFNGCHKLSSITLSENLDYIGGWAFYGCSSLTNVTIPNSVTKIGATAFYGCSGLTSITIPDGVTGIGKDVFNGCSGLKSVTIPNTITKIGDNAFKGCSSLTSITIPSSVTSIGDWAFCDCLGLTSVTIPNSVTSIGSYAFKSCSDLKSVTIPNSVTSIGEYAFYACSNATIYCECEETLKPSEWDESWNDDRTVIWGCKVIKLEVNTEHGTANASGYAVNANDGTMWYLNNAQVTLTSTPQNGFHVVWENNSTENNRTFYATESKTYTATFEAHTETYRFENINPATCTVAGSQDSVVYCSVCNKELYRETLVISALQHSYGTPTYVWAEDGSACTATTVCQHDNNHVITENATITSEVTIASTCEGMGTTTYTAKFTDSKFSKQTKDVVDIPALGHDYGEATYVWAEDGSSCTATTVCKHDEYHIVTENATITSEVTIASTCEGMGTTTYTANFTDNNFSTQTKNVVDIPALQHSYGASTYVWAEDGSACTATTVCQHDANHVITENANITSEVTTAATCEGMGTTTYTAAFSDSKFATQTKNVVDIHALQHSYGTPTYVWAEDGSACTATTVCQHDANHVETENATITSEETIAPTCEEMGTTTYTANFTDNNFSTQTKNVVDISALQHSYGAPTYVWAEDGSACTATTVCQHDANHVATENATITSEETIAPTCEEMGTTTYTAAFTDSKFSTQTKNVVDIPALQHSYGAPTYDWAEDGSSCTATTVCQHDANHVVTENATITSEETIAPTCEEMGTTTYTANFTDSKFSTQTKAVMDILANGHTNGEAVFENEEAPTCTTVGSRDSVVYCSVCNKELYRETLVIPAKGHTEVTDAAKAPTCTETGLTEGKHCSVCNTVLVAQQNVEALGHTEVTDAAKAPTCTETGLTEGKHCSVCETVILAQEAIPALGHMFENYIFNNDATTEADGTETAVCEHGCGATDTRVAEGTKLPKDNTTVNESAASAVSIFAHHNIIVVENADAEINVYNAMGALVATTNDTNAEIRINVSGVYVVRVGNTAKRVMISD